MLINVGNIINNHFKSLGKKPEQHYYPAFTIALVAIFVTKLISPLIALSLLAVNVAFLIIMFNFFFLISMFSLSKDEESVKVDDGYYLYKTNKTKKEEEYKRERKKFKKDLSAELTKNIYFGNILAFGNIIILVIFTIDYTFGLLFGKEIAKIASEFIKMFIYGDLWVQIKYILNFAMYFLTVMYLITIQCIFRRVQLLLSY
jgi:hypothetical protein